MTKNILFKSTFFAAIFLASMAVIAKDKVSMLILVGHGEVSSHMQRSVLRAPEVVQLLNTSFVANTYDAKRLDLRYYSIQRLPTVLIFGRNRKIYRHEGGFPGPDAFVSFALAAIHSESYRDGISSSLPSDPLPATAQDGSTGE